MIAGVAAAVGGELAGGSEAPFVSAGGSPVLLMATSLSLLGLFSLLLN